MRMRSLAGALICTVACLTAARAREARTGRFQTTFDERSPLSIPAAFWHRLRTDDERENGDEDYSLADETFEVYVPRGYTPDEPAGLYVWISAGDGGGPRGDWLPIFDEQNLIYVGANKSGNGRLPSWQRIGMALDGAHNIMKRYEIDAARVYVSGISGGGGRSCKTALYHPELFTGCYIMCAPVTFEKADAPDFKLGKSFEPPPADVYDKAKRTQRYVHMAGANDDNAKPGIVEAVARQNFNENGFHHKCTFIEVPDIGHTTPNGEWFEKGIAALDAPLFAEAKSRYDAGVKLQERGRLGAALARHARAVSHAKGQPWAKDAASRLAALRRGLRERTSACKAHFEAKEYRQARTKLKELVKQYGDEAAEARALLKRINTDKDILAALRAQADREAEHERAKQATLSLMRARVLVKKDLVKGHAELKRIAARYPTTPSGEQAKALADEIWSDPAKRRRLQSASSSKRAASLLRQAKNFAANGMNDMARTYLKKVMKEYPDTKEANEAERLLQRLR